ncbi:calcium-binding protein [Rhizobacter sp. SG703]|uniref:calcium-binding protein n=1 Tax=Rhizobacter sp. SG703 TaxID=2587140 RepID=UPI0017DA4141|nr:calcium-binding protein [Rhizobacter sp. SG703]NKI93740.1 Ca2+-binding RTX toxin-like protein [Rhizobacter sp. SG703]
MAEDQKQNINVATQLEYAMLQLAAEAMFGVSHTDSPGQKITAAMTREMLLKGNDHSSRFTEAQVDAFLQDWKLVEHQSNTATGFSGTLFQYQGFDKPELGLHEGQLVMSFRSTEFIEDSARDNEATNTLEVKATGFALGQIADMEQWYGELKQRYPIEFSDSQGIDITGYSLGGHLATAFTLMHGPDIHRTVTFNGAGVGDVKSGAGTLNDVIDKFAGWRDNGNADVFATDEAKALYAQLKQHYSGTADVTAAQAKADIDLVESKRPYIPVLTPLGVRKEYVHTPFGDDLALLKQALERIASIASISETVFSLTAGGDDAMTMFDKPARIVGLDDIAGLGLDYQLAVLRASQLTAPYRADELRGALDAYFGRNVKTELPNFFDLYGQSPPSAVSNSQWHYGTKTPVLIEDQPMYRGNYIGGTALASAAAWGIRLLIDKYNLNDFGDTHSLVLIVDSLSLQKTLTTLDGSVDQKAMSDIYAVAGNSAGIQGPANNDQGQSEGDTLERVLQSLADQLGFSSSAWTKLNPSLAGGTWANVADKNGVTGRATFQQDLKLLVESDVFKSLVGKVSLRPSTALSGSTVKQRAGFQEIAALLTLSPFVLMPMAAGVAAMTALWEAEPWRASYLAWKADQALVAAGKPAETYTDQWIDDRLTLLSYVEQVNGANNQTGTLDDLTLPIGTASLYTYIDPFTGERRPLEASNVPKMPDDAGAVTPRPSTQSLITFGGDANDAFIGDELGDHLYGGGGADKINAGSGNDYIEGNAGVDSLYGEKGNDVLLGGAGDDWLSGGIGNDLLNGGAGADTYEVKADEDVDTIVSSDAVDILKLGGRNLDGSGTVKSSVDGVTVWIDESDAAAPILYMLDANIAQLTVAGYGSTVIVKDFQSGDLGILAPVPTPPVAPPPAPIDFIDFLTPDSFDKYKAWSRGGRPVATFVNIAGGMARVEGSSGNDLMTGGTVVGTTATSPLNFNSTQIVGRAGDDRIFAVAVQTEAQALAGTPTLAAQEGPVLDGGRGNDFLVGSSADDLVFGGEGNDRVITGAGNDIVMSDGDLGPGFLSFADFSATARLMGGANTNGIGGTGGTVRYLDAVNSHEYTIYITPKGWTGNPAGAGAKLTLAYQSVDPLQNIDLRAFARDQLGTQVLPESNSLYAAVVANLGYTPGSFDLVIQGVNRDTGNGYGSDPADPNPATRLLDSFSTAAHAGNDVIDTGDGDDVVNAGGGNDVVRAGTGNDVVAGYQGSDLVHGDAGNDLLYGDYHGTGGLIIDPNTGIVRGRSGLDGSQHGNDLLYGDAGNDVVIGNGGSDILDGGDGDDELHGDEAGIDVRWAGNDKLDGGAGKDTLTGGARDDELRGGTGDDVLFGDADTTYTAGADHGRDRLFGDDGDDRLYGGGNDDTLLGGAGNDQLLGDDFIGNVAGSFHGKDVLDGGAGDDVLAGGGGNDELSGGDGNDWLAGEDEQATDEVSTLTGDDRLDGGVGKDTLIGGNGRDALLGGADDDMLFGGAGNDTLDGGSGADALSGGAGDDTYVLTLDGIAQSGGVNDTIVDASGKDVIQMDFATNAVQVARSGDDLLVAIDATHGFVVRNGANGAIEHYSFSDGRTLDTVRLIGERLMQGQDLRSGATSSRPLIGGAVADQLWGGQDDVASTLSGGRGDDWITLANTSGSVVLYSKGDGRDTVNVSNAGRTGENVLKLSDGLQAADLRLRCEADTFRLVLDLGPAGDRLVLATNFQNALLDVPVAFDRFEFDDGSSLTWQQLLDRGVLVENTRPGPFYYGTSAPDVMVGSDQSRRIDGGGGNDDLRAGSGNETLVGGAGDDLYRIGRGIGSDIIDDTAATAGEIDRIRFDDTIAVSDLRYVRDGNDVVVLFNGLPDHLRLTGFFTNAGRQQLVFGDGTVYERGNLPVVAWQALLTAGDDLLQVFGTSNDTLDALGGNDVVRGGAGDDSIRGGDGNDWLAGEDQSSPFDWTELSGNDTLDGGAGNDTLVSGAGDDVLVGGAGDDLLYGGSGDDTYVLRRGDGVDVISDMLGGQVGYEHIVFSDMLLSEVRVDDYGGRYTFSYGAGDRLTVDHFGDVEFADGTLWTAQTLAPHATLHRGGSEANDELFSYEDRPMELHGAGGSDILRGQSHDDTLFGDDGDDWLQGRQGNDQLDGGADRDMLEGGEGDDLLQGGAGRDTLYGGVGSDSLYGGDGDDLLQGADAMAGDAGADLLHGGDGDDTLTGTAGADGNGGRLFGDAGDDRLQGSAGADWLDGGDGNDAIYGVGEGSGVDTVVGGHGDDSISLTNLQSADLVFSQGDGHDLVTDVQYVGGIGSTGAASRWRVAFDASVAAASVHVVGIEATVLQNTAGEGMKLTLAYGTQGDTVSFALSYRAIEFQLQSPTLNFTFADGTTRSLADLMPSLQNVPVYGGAGDDHLWSAGTFSLNSSGRWQVLSSGSTLTGGQGNDTLVGLEGNDTYVFNRGDGNDVVRDYGGTDTFRFGAGIRPEDLSLRVETYRVWDFYSERVIEINQGGGQIRLGAISGSDDAYDMSAITKLPGYSFGTIDSFRFDDGTVLTMDQLVARVGAFNVVADSQYGYMVGTEQSDRFEGGVGMQAMQGKGGADTYVFKRGDSQWLGTDPLQSSDVDRIADTSTGNVLEFGAGIAMSDLRFTRQDSTLVVEVLGGAVKDAFMVYDYFTNPQMFSLLRFADGSTVDVSQGIRVPLLGTAGDDVMNGTAVADYFDGGAGNDQLNGKAGRDWLQGGSGNDRLDGGADADDLAGGSGDDTYIVDNAGDLVTEATGEGTDSVQASVSYTLSANVENLTLATGNTGLSATGNGGANTLTGNAGANRLDGGQGADTMIGGAGNDTYVLDDIGDRITEASGGGTDTVESWINWTLTSELEKLTLLGSQNLTATGNSVANTLTGNAGNNVLDGAGGVDTMIGGAGDDTYAVDVSGETIAEVAGQGIDTVNSQVSITTALWSNVENLNLLGSGNLTGLGNELDNLLFGNSGANTLSGAAGNDTYYGGGGNDTLSDTASSNDVYRWGRGDGQDTITDAGGTDRIEIASGISAAQLTQTRSGNNLVLGISGVTTDKLTITNYYVGTANKIETIKLADGTTVPITVTALATSAPTEKAMPVSVPTAVVAAWATLDVVMRIAEPAREGLPTPIAAAQTGAAHDLSGPGLALSRDAVLWRREHAL